MESNTILLLIIAVTWLVVIPIIIIFPPLKHLSFMRMGASLLQRRRNLRIVRSTFLSDKDWSSSSPTTAASPSQSFSSPVCVAPRNKSILLVFVNPKSGGQLGDQLLAALKRVLPATQVFDLSQRTGAVDPSNVLSKFAFDANVRILCCGGDGTVSWITQIAIQVGRQQFPIGILPLGTGNDLSRCLGWGPGASSAVVDPDTLLQLLARVVVAHPRPLDLWTVSITPTERGSGSAGAATKKVMMNYFSCGLDAEIAVQFHKEREESPSNFTSQAGNQLIYARLGLEKSFTSEFLDGKVSNFMAGSSKVTMRPVAYDIGVLKALAIANVPAYQGGKDFWSDFEGTLMQEGDLASSTSGDHEDFKPVSVEDGKLECFGMSGSLHFGLTHLMLDSAIRIAQQKCFSLKLTTRQAVQIDGEPMILDPCTIEIERLQQYPMLECILDE